MNNLIERSISAVCLFILAITFVLAVAPQSFLRVLAIGGIFACIGFFYSYKTSLLPADNLGYLPPRSVAAMWLGALAFIPLSMLVWNVIEPIVTKSFPLANSTYIHLLTTFIISAMLLGWFYVYKFLQLPKISYKKSFPDWTDRIKAGLLYGFAGYITFRFINSAPVSLFDLAIFLLSVYVGSMYGWRALMLPKHSVFLAGKIGFTSASYTLLIFLLFSIASRPPEIPIDFLIMPIFMFLVVGWSVAIAGIISSIILYLVAR